MRLRRAKATEPPAAHGGSRPSAFPAALAGLLVVVVALAAVWIRTVVDRDRREVVASWQGQLQALSQGYRFAIEEWVQMRWRDATVLASFPTTQILLGSRTSAPSAPPDPRAAEHEAEILDDLATGQLLRFVQIVDVRGTVVARTGSGDEGISVAAVVRACIEREEPASDFVLPGENEVVLFAVPVFAKPTAAPTGRRVIGAVVLGENADAWLLRFLQQARNFGHSAEAFLIRREDTEVVFLTPLRFAGREGAFTRRPIDLPDLPAALALRQRPLPTLGRDYRGARVLASYEPVPGTGWVLLTKVDEAEALAPWREQTRGTVATGVAIVAFFAAAFYAIWRDRQRRYERLVEASLLRAGALLKGAFDPIFLLDREGRVIDCNEQAEKLYGYSTAEFRNMSFSDLGVPGSSDGWAAATHTLDAEGAVVTQGEHLSRNGSVIPVEVGSRLLRYQAEELIIAVVRDVTERKAAGDRITFLNRLLRTISEINQLLIREHRSSVLLGEACRIAVQHGGFLMAWVGLTDSGSGRLEPCVSSGHDDGFLSTVEFSVAETDRQPTPAERAARSGRLAVLQDIAAEPSPAAWRAAALDRGYHATAAAPIKVDGRTIGVFVVYATEAGVFVPEVTALLEELANDLGFALGNLERDEQLRQAQKMEAIGRLAGGVAHDFNNLLQAMLATSQVLRGHLREPERLERGLRELEEHARRGAALTRQLLLFSRRESAKLEHVALNAIVEDSVTLLRRLIRENIAIEVTLVDGETTLKADRGQLEQVLMNLALNASDVMTNGGTVEIATSLPAPGRVSVTVRDTGPGIAREIREKVFDPFFTTKPPGHGTGLGLSVVHGIVARHAGEIRVEDAPGGGALFRITFPLSSSGEQPVLLEGADDWPSRPIRAGKPRILVVEDEAPAREALAEILVALGYDATLVGTAAEALTTPDMPPFDLLLTDYLLPDTMGDQLAEILRRRWPEVTVILMSGYTDDEIVRRAVAGGAMRFLQKPFDIGTLDREIVAALAARDSG
ncbi:MAG: ATP-binding protein [Acidobacteriota bacterium]